MNSITKKKNQTKNHKNSNFSKRIHEDSLFNNEDSLYNDALKLSHLNIDRVLILNQSYEPLSVCSPLKAITLVFLSKAELIITRNDKVIKSVNSVFPYPSVIKLNEYKRIGFREIVVNKKNVMKRDGYMCQYCGTKHLQLTIDHIIPKSRGGKDTWDNLITACFRCNNAKGDRTPSEAKMHLLNKPFKPSYFGFLFSGLKNQNEEWKQFLFN